MKRPVGRPPGAYPKLYKMREEGTTGLTPDDIRDIHRRIWHTVESFQQIADHYGVSRMAITKICRGECWPHIAAECVPEHYAGHLVERVQRYG